MSEAFFSLLVFVLLMVGTPGPANMLAMIGGARLGLRECLGFIAGLTVGKIGVNVLFGVGFGLLLAEHAGLLLALKLVSAAYLAWLAIQSWTPHQQNGRDARKGLRFREGLIVHPLNPKAWVMSLLAWTQFAPDLGDFWQQMFVVCMTFAICQIITHTAWCYLGSVIGKAIPNSLFLTRSLVVLTVCGVVWALLQ